jgi:23S rRNA (uracil1939-C5)-methyltransferase
MAGHDRAENRTTFVYDVSSGSPDRSRIVHLLRHLLRIEDCILNESNNPWLKQLIILIDPPLVGHYPCNMGVRLPATESRDRRLSQRDRAAHHSSDHPCPHSPRCIGCPLIDVPYSEQLVRKQQLIGRSFEKYPSLTGIRLPCVTPAPFRLGYRTRIKLVVRATAGDIAAGLYFPGTHRVMDISSCAVHPRPVNQVVRYLKKKCLELKIVPYDERVDTGQLRYLDLRYSFARREMSVTLVTRHGEFPQGRTLARALMRKFTSVGGVIQNINEQRGNVIWGERYKVLAGRETLLEKIGRLTLAYPAGVFSQANPAAAQIVYDAVGEMAELNKRDTVLDLYCGVGPIALTLAHQARIVCGFDDNLLAIDTAKQNARRNGVANCRFFHGDAAQKIAEAQSSFGRIDCVVLNPPRKGVQPPALAALIALQAPRLVYVSCEPATLARDTDRLVQQGYRLRDLRSFDMFPQTDQVETVALLEK